MGKTLSQEPKCRYVIHRFYDQVSFIMSHETYNSEQQANTAAEEAKASIGLSDRMTFVIGKVRA